MTGLRTASFFSLDFVSIASTAVSGHISKGMVRLPGGCDYAQMLKLFGQTHFRCGSSRRCQRTGPLRMTWVVPGGGGEGHGDVSWRGLRSRQWQEGAFKSTPGRIGKGLHPAHGTQRRAPGGSRVPHVKCGQSAARVRAPPERDFSSPDLSQLGTSHM